MKWALAQLYKYNQKTFYFEDSYDFSEEISLIEDILDLSPVTIKGEGRNTHGDRFVFKIHIEAEMTLECAISLEPIKFPIKLDIVEIFDCEDDGEVNLITSNTIDLRPLVWEIVYLEKPIRITKYDNSNDKIE